MSLKQYISDTKSEMKHVNWPTKKQTVVYTILVIAISVVVSLYIAGLDTIFTGLFTKFILPIF